MGGSRSKRFTVADLFATLDGRVYVGEGNFQRAVITVFNDHLRDFPPHYSYRDAIIWAMRQGWLDVDGSHVTISFPARAAAPPPASTPLSLAA